MYGLAPVSVLIYTTNIVNWTGKSFFIQLEGILLCLIVSSNTAKMAVDDYGLFSQKERKSGNKFLNKKGNLLSKWDFPKFDKVISF